MGQQSSQLEASQFRTSLDTAPSSLETYFSPKSSQSQKMAHKRVRSPDQDDALLPPRSKRVRTKEERDRKQKKMKREPGRSMPQHRRGTAIMPSQETAVSRSPVRIEPQNRAVEGSELQETSLQLEKQPSNTSAAALTPPEAPPAHDPRQQVEAIESNQKRSKEKKGRSEGNVAEGDAEILAEMQASLLSEQSPPKKKKEKRSTEDVLSNGGAGNLDYQESPPEVSMPDTDISPASARAGAVQDYIERNAQLPLHKDAHSHSEPKERQVSDSEDDVVIRVNRAGKPGPKRKKRKPESINGSRAAQLDLAPELQPHNDASPPIVNDVVQRFDKTQETSTRVAPPANFVLTPPISQPVASTNLEPTVRSGQEEDYDAALREGYVETSSQVSEWLQSQQPPLPPDQGSPVLGATKRAAKSNITEETGNAKRSKRFDVDDDDGDVSDEYQDEKAVSDVGGSMDEVMYEPTPKKMSKGKKSKSKKSGQPPKVDSPVPVPSGGERGTIKGPWTAEEKALADSIFSSSCNAGKQTAPEMKRQITDWHSVGAFKEEMYDAFPFRTKDTIKKFCKRRFQPYTTGPWTKEEDESMKRQITQVGKNWVSVGEHVGRAPEACRDRWRNIVQHGDKMEKGPWSVQEEGRLVEAVQDILVTLKEECKDEDIKNDPEQLETMIDWKAVVDILEGRRSAKRCLEKWKILKRRIPVTEDSVLQISASQTQQSEEKSKVQKSLEIAYSRLGWVDVHEALIEICSATAAHPAAEYEHESTLWAVVGAANPGSNFPPKLRRRCYHKMLEHFASSDALSKAVGIGGKAQVLADHLNDLKKSGKVEWESSMVKRKRTKKTKSAEDRTSDVSESEAVEPVRKPRSRASKSNTGGRDKIPKSAALVEDSDDE